MNVYVFMGKLTSIVEKLYNGAVEVTVQIREVQTVLDSNSLTLYPNTYLVVGQLNEMVYPILSFLFCKMGVVTITFQSYCKG